MSSCLRFSFLVWHSIFSTTSFETPCLRSRLLFASWWSWLTGSGIPMLVLLALAGEPDNGCSGERRRDFFWALAMTMAYSRRADHLAWMLVFFHSIKVFFIFRFFWRTMIYLDFPFPFEVRTNALINFPQLLFFPLRRKSKYWLLCLLSRFHRFRLKQLNLIIITRMRSSWSICMSQFVIVNHLISFY